MTSEFSWTWFRSRWIPAVVSALLAHSASAGAIHLKNRTVPSLDGGASRLGRHFLLQFRSYPDAAIRAQLSRRGMRVLSYVPESTLVVSSTAAPDLRGLDLESAGVLDPSDKISPLLRQRRAGAYLVMMFPDVTPPAAHELLDQQGFTIIPQAGLLPSDYVVVGPSAKLADLARADEVSYILPAPADLSSASMTACAGALTEAGVVAQYVEEGPGWAPSPSSTEVALNYTFESLPPNLDGNAVRSEIIRALNQWASYSNLKFSSGSDPQAVRTIAIKFATGQHGDAYPFDGPGMLAHTFYPSPPNNEPIAGDMHLNLAENWQTASALGIDLFSVALHEAGHALGLGHTDNPDSVMYPYYRTLAGLSTDDIAGIRALYGVNDPTSTAQPIDPSTPVTTTAPPAANGPTTPVLIPPFPIPGTPTATPPASPPAATPSTPPVTPAPPAPATPGTPAANPSPAKSDTTPPSLKIVSPASTIVSTTADSLTISGTASDNMGVASVTWTSSTGGRGVATGTTRWSAQIPLFKGDNVVVVTASDAAGNSSWRALTVVRW